VAVEAQPIEQWVDRALGEERSTAALTAMMALARVGDPAIQSRIFDRLAHFSLDILSEEQQLIALRGYEVTIIRQRQPDTMRAEKLVATLDAAYPSASPRVNQELCELLVTLGAPNVVKKTMPLVLSSKTQEERLRYLFALREVRQGWTLDDRRNYFEWLSRPDSFAGAHTMPGVLSNIRKDALASLSDDERAQLSPLLATLNQQAAAPSAAPNVQRPFVWDWTLADLTDSLEQLSAGRDFDRGRRLYSAALCDRCHRLAGRGTAVGPELTGSGNRFGRKDLLETILSPSKFVDEKYRDTALELADGKLMIGRVLGDDGQSLIMGTNPFDPKQVARIDHSAIASRSWSLLSPMPTGLLNTLSKEEIFDLLAYLIADGDETHATFARP
jgi:putative heme-binding domain-containing protein